MPPPPPKFGQRDLFNDSFLSFLRWNNKSQPQPAPNGNSHEANGEDAMIEKKNHVAEGNRLLDLTKDLLEQYLDVMTKESVKKFRKAAAKLTKAAPQKSKLSKKSVADTVAFEQSARQLYQEVENVVRELVQPAGDLRHGERGSPISQGSRSHSPAPLPRKPPSPKVTFNTQMKPESTGELVRQASTRHGGEEPRHRSDLTRQGTQTSKHREAREDEVTRSSSHRNDPTRSRREGRPEDDRYYYREDGHKRSDSYRYTSDRYRDRDRDHYRDRDRDYKRSGHSRHYSDSRDYPRDYYDSRYNRYDDRDRERDRERDGERYREKDREKYRDRDTRRREDKDREREREREWERERERDRERDREREHRSRREDPMRVVHEDAPLSAVKNSPSGVPFTPTYVDYPQEDGRRRRERDRDTHEREPERRHRDDYHDKRDRRDYDADGYYKSRSHRSRRYDDEYYQPKHDRDRGDRDRDRERSGREGKGRERDKGKEKEKEREHGDERAGSRDNENEHAHPPSAHGGDSPPMTPLGDPSHSKFQEVFSPAGPHSGGVMLPPASEM